MPGCTTASLAAAPFPGCRHPHLCRCTRPLFRHPRLGGRSGAAPCASSPPRPQRKEKRPQGLRNRASGGSIRGRPWLLIGSSWAHLSMQKLWPEDKRRKTSLAFVQNATPAPISRPLLMCQGARASRGRRSCERSPASRSTSPGTRRPTWISDVERPTVARALLEHATRQLAFRQSESARNVVGLANGSIAVARRSRRSRKGSDPERPRCHG